MDLQSLEDVVGNYSEYGFPLDTIWSDIDYMKDYRDFTYDEKRFDGLPDFVNRIHEDHLHYIPIIDAGVAKRDDDKDYFGY